MTGGLLNIRNLRIALNGADDQQVVKGLNLSIEPGQTMCLVGESGSGKSLSALATMGLLPSVLSPLAGSSILLKGEELLTANSTRLRDLRATGMSMIFQEPMTALNPVFRIGHQISEALILHQGMTKEQALKRSVEMLELVQIPEAEQRVKEYPHQLSGGMRQRVMIAMALACNPKVLIADEPTTALDVTIQAQILDLVLKLQKDLDTAVILITHDLGVIAETAKRVVVMYAGKKVEEGSVEDLFAEPLHPYTHGLLASVPHLDIMKGEESKVERLAEIPGIVPMLIDLPGGCTFAPRCPHADEKCKLEYPPYVERKPDHWVACWHSDKLYGENNG